MSTMPRLVFIPIGLLLWAGCSGAESGAPHSEGVAGSASAATTAGTGGVGVAAGGTSIGGASAGSGAGQSSVAGSPASGGEAGGTGGAGMSGTVSCRAKGDGKSTITMINHCAETLSFRGSDIEGGELAPGEHACRDVGSDVESIPAIRFWGFSGEDPGGEKHTLAELTLNTDFNDFDWYNISHVDAHNLPMQVAPVSMDECRVLTCAESLLADCPIEGQLEDSQGKLISCFSPDRDNPNSTVAKYFEAGCADAYSRSGDDQDSVAACAGEDYDVVFCP
jgi:hypothetical protein